MLKKLTFFDEPAGTKSVIVSVEEKNRCQEIVVVVKFGISSENIVGFLFHLKKLCGWVHWLLFSVTHYNWREILVCPGASIRVTVFVILAFKELFAFSLINCDV